MDLNNLSHFRENYFKDFLTPPLNKGEEGRYFNGELVETLEGKTIPKGEGFINVGFKAGGVSSELSNLYPHEFEFKGRTVGSAEGIFQGIKFKDKDEQSEILKLSGMEALNSKERLSEPWQQERLLYWQGEPMNRYQRPYERFIDGVYEGLLKNQNFVRALREVPKETYILHSIGKGSPKETVLTRCEFERELNMLHDYVLREQ